MYSWHLRRLHYTEQFSREAQGHRLAQPDLTGVAGTCTGLCVPDPGSCGEIGRSEFPSHTFPQFSPQLVVPIVLEHTHCIHLRGDSSISYALSFDQACAVNCCKSAVKAALFVSPLGTASVVFAAMWRLTLLSFVAETL